MTGVRSKSLREHASHADHSLPDSLELQSCWSDTGTTPRWTVRAAVCHVDTHHQLAILVCWLTRLKERKKPLRSTSISSSSFHPPSKTAISTQDRWELHLCPAAPDKNQSRGPTTSGWSAMGPPTEKAAPFLRPTAWLRPRWSGRMWPVLRTGAQKNEKTPKVDCAGPVFLFLFLDWPN